MSSDGFNADETVIMKPNQARDLPESIGKYKIVDLLGKGGMGTVYLGKDPDLSRHVAIKTLSPRAMEMTEEQRKQFVERFYREARSLALLDHVNIVRIHDLGEVDNVLYLVMEYVDGLSLTQIIRTRPHLDLDAKLAMVRQICEGVTFIHDSGLIHRDIKPDNIMLDRAGVIKIMDFGTVRTDDSDLTRTTQVLGTPRYMAPEQLQGAFGDIRSDVFSLGAVFYELLTGEKAFLGDNFTTIAYKLSTEDPIRPSRVNSILGREVDRVLYKAMSKSPEDRQQSVRELGEDVEAAIRGGSGGGAAGMALKLGAALLLVALVLGGVWAAGLIPGVPGPDEISLFGFGPEPGPDVVEPEHPDNAVPPADVVPDNGPEQDDGQPEDMAQNGTGTPGDPAEATETDVPATDEHAVVEDGTDPDVSPTGDPDPDALAPDGPTPDDQAVSDSAPDDGGDDPADASVEEHTDTTDTADNGEDVEPGEEAGVAQTSAISAIGPVAQPVAADRVVPGELPGIGEAITPQPGRNDASDVEEQNPDEVSEVLETDLAAEDVDQPSPEEVGIEAEESDPPRDLAIVTQDEASLASEDQQERPRVIMAPMGAPPFGLDIQSAFMGVSGDLRPLSPGAVLKQGDEYRLVLTPDKTCYLYLFERTPSGVRMLYPVSFSEYGDPAGVNPVGQMERLVLPVEDESFTLEYGGGGALLLIASSGADEELEHIMLNIKEMDMSGNLVQLRYWKDRLISRLTGSGGVYSAREEVVLFPWRGVDRLMRLPVMHVSLDQNAVFELPFTAVE